MSVCTALQGAASCHQSTDLSNYQVTLDQLLVHWNVCQSNLKHRLKLSNSTKQTSGSSGLQAPSCQCIKCRWGHVEDYLIRKFLLPLVINFCFLSHIMLHIFVMYSEMNRIICSKFTHSKITVYYEVHSAATKSLPQRNLGIWKRPTVAVLYSKT